MINTTTKLAHIKGSARDFLFQFQDENRPQTVQYGGEISWEASSTITKDNLLLRFIPMVRFFTPYKYLHPSGIFDIHALPGDGTLVTVSFPILPN
jgi:hypothetical protein